MIVPLPAFMKKWEYAAIVGNESDGWNLIKPVNDRPLRRYVGSIMKPTEELKIDQAWRLPPNYLLPFFDPRNKRSKKEPDWKYENVLEPLFYSADILYLINIAGEEGWELTGGIGLGNSAPGQHETRWRVMRREL